MTSGDRGRLRPLTRTCEGVRSTRKKVIAEPRRLRPHARARAVPRACGAGALRIGLRLTRLRRLQLRNYCRFASYERRLYRGRHETIQSSVSTDTWLAVGFRST